MAAALFDIEGTILPISFIAEVLFPAALQALPSFVSENWSSEGEFADIKARFPEDTLISQEAFVSYCKELNSTNSKFPPWKTLQGILWRQSYESGKVKAPLYYDVLPALHVLKKAGVKIYIYSSGSVEAQKLLFAHTTDGDVRGLLDGYFDPPSLSVQNKFDVKGYDKIKERTGIKSWTFFSDVPMEVDAARKAGMKGYVVVREGNKPLTDEERKEYTLIEGFNDILGLVSQ